MRCTGISQAEFYAAVESLRVDGPTVWDIRWSEASSEVDDRIRFSWRHNLVLVMEWTVIRILHDLRRLFSCRKSALPAFFSYKREACVHKHERSLPIKQESVPVQHFCCKADHKVVSYISLYTGSRYGEAIFNAAASYKLQTSWYLKKAGYPYRNVRDPAFCLVFNRID